jgi:SAM-dependent methyltransferase
LLVAFLRGSATLQKGEIVSQPAGYGTGNLEKGTEDLPAYYGNEFWRRENLKFAAPWYRLEKCARLIDGVARGRPSTLLDVGCGPAALRQLVPLNIEYYGIDIAIQNPGPNLLEVDILDGPVRFGEKRFDIVVASGIFEYLGEFQSQKLQEISQIVKPGGTFIVSYTNFAHRARRVYERLNNVQPVESFERSVSEYFRVEHTLPASYNWKHSQPSRKIVREINMHLNFNIPFISRALAVEYFFICSPLR